MSDKKFLSYEDQFKEVLNQDEINLIQDPGLRGIRLKYWNLRHKAFLDEHNISDTELNKVWNDLIHQEQNELQRFRNRNTNQ